ncbi:MAG: hypothetical protein WC231_01535 [Dehalococcoidales bacterium]|jgi:hypothetical protein|nr:hypothetical protein [Dehalococcoidales bacterium]MDD5604397.1 hypothetical protein [Dehalococcoidales bacterium]MDX9985978.1 hypothetical protein [Dehalococcoidales bacterium]NLE90084.1 hypothetical protein [Dehalococcoidales bacterium]
MTQKSKKSRKIKRIPVRVISPQTAEMPLNKTDDSSPVEVKSNTVNFPIGDYSLSTVVKEIKRAGVITAITLIILVIMYFIL